MKKLLIVLVVAALGWIAWSRLAAPDGPDLTITGSEIALATADLDVRFTRSETLDGTYMLFGGGTLDHPNAVSNVTLAGLHMKDVRRIAERYPDFYMCKSPGAPLAQKAVVDLDLVPADGKVRKTLDSALDQFESSLHSDGGRVCVSLRGEALDLKSAKIRDHDEEVTETYRQTRFYLVTSASVVDCQAASGRT